VRSDAWETIAFVWAKQSSVCAQPTRLDLVQSERALGVSAHARIWAQCDSPVGGLRPKLGGSPCRRQLGRGVLLLRVAEFALELAGNVYGHVVGIIAATVGAIGALLANHADRIVIYEK
jgi:hypothetical protein